MEQYDSIVIGGGSGLDIAASLANRGETVAIVEKGPMGGTCLNRGCIPSKIIIHSADVAQTIQASSTFGIDATIDAVEFQEITQHASGLVDDDAAHIEQSIRQSENLTLYKMRGQFVDERTIQVGNTTITAEKMYVVAGTRPFVPPIDGLASVGYLTSQEALRLEEQPDSLAIIGGGYIAAELAHFYHSVGTEVTIIQRSTPLVKQEDQEVAEVFTDSASKQYTVLLEWNTDCVTEEGGQITVHISHKETGEEQTVTVDQLLVATGRQPNTDLLNVEAAGIETDENGFIAVNEYMETSAENVWAAGDIAGNFLFKHAANEEAEYALWNSVHPDQKSAVDYTAMPHAIFSSPQIAGVGQTEEALQEEGRDYTVGKEFYANTGMGAALQEDDGFVKFLVDPADGTILGCHILGPEAPTLLHEVLVAMRAGDGTVHDITNTIHIHPALSEVVQRAAGKVNR